MLRSLNSSRVKKLYRTFRMKGWEKRDTYGIYSEDMVRLAVNAGVVCEILYVGECNIPFDKKTGVTPEVMNYITVGAEEKIAAVCKKVMVPMPEGDISRILMLDRVMFRTNIGRIINIAYTYGVDVIYTQEGDGINYWTQAVIKNSLGKALFMPRIPTSLPDKIKELRQQGWYCLGTSLQNAIPLSDIPVRDKMVIIVGNESDGVSEEVLQETDVNCRIEMENYDSLNVGIATAIVLHYCCT